MDKYKNKPKTILISEEGHTDYQMTLNAKISQLWEEGAEIHEIKPFTNEYWIFALIIYS